MLFVVMVLVAPFVPFTLERSGSPLACTAPFSGFWILWIF